MDGNLVEMKMEHSDICRKLKTLHTQLARLEPREIELFNAITAAEQAQRRADEDQHPPADAES